ncbi:MAG: ABC transporter ATP-binding protein, partial [Oscillospiraceae bacterium]|nr:ABC transporter ATP-binding protein [Oscillospiraceae bacterium]
MAKDEYKIGQSPKHKGPPPPRGMRGVEKPKNFKETWGKLLVYSKKYWVVMILAVLFSAISTLLTLMGPDKISELTNIIKNGLFTRVDMSAVTKTGVTLISFYAVGFILAVAQGFIMAIVTQRVTQGLRSDISVKINNLPMSYYNRTSTGDVLSRVTNDIDSIGQSMNSSIGGLVSSVTLFVGSLIMMLKTNVIMALTAVLASVIGIALMGIIMGNSQK